MRVEEPCFGLMHVICCWALRRVRREEGARRIRLSTSSVPKFWLLWLLFDVTLSVSVCFLL